MPKQRKLHLQPLLAEPNVGDRIATHFLGCIRYGRVAAIFPNTFRVEFEGDPEEGGYQVDRTEVWKVRDAHSR